MVGDYDKEEFNSGDGAMVRDNAVFLIAALNLKFNFDPGDLTFHVECKQDNHDCPGKKVVKADVISRVREMMATLRSGPGDICASALARCIRVGGSIQARLLNITATEFGGEGTSNLLLMRMCPTVGPIVPASRCLVGSPGRVPKVRVFKGDRSILCDIVDVGPWYPSARGPEDKYWETGARPRAESDDRTNRAGIDLTPAAAAAIDLDGKGDRPSGIQWRRAGRAGVRTPVGSRTVDAVFTAGSAHAAPRPHRGRHYPECGAAWTVGRRRLRYLHFWTHPGRSLPTSPGPDDITTLLERLLPLIEKLQGRRGRARRRPSRPICSNSRSSFAKHST